MMAKYDRTESESEGGNQVFCQRSFEIVFARQVEKHLMSSSSSSSSFCVMSQEDGSYPSANVYFPAQ
jgi:hypothetical protein